MGFSPRDVIQLFLNQGILLGFVGGLFGLILGFFICKILARIEVAPGRMSGPGNLMIISFDALIYIKAFFIASISSILSSILPAREAGKLEPIEIIRTGGQ
jgi:lipoprotein-releasing system permease protein